MLSRCGARMLLEQRHSMGLRWLRRVPQDSRKSEVVRDEAEELYRTLVNDNLLQNTRRKSWTDRKTTFATENSNKSRGSQGAAERESNNPKPRNSDNRKQAEINVNNDGRKTYRSFKQQIKKLKLDLNAQVVTRENQFEMVRSAVTMLHHLPYAHQLQLKEMKNSEVVEILKKRSKSSPQVRNCKQSSIVASPVTEKYRSKDEFSVYTDIEGQATVGFYVGGRSTGVVCVDPRLVSILKDSHKTAASKYQQLIRSSGLQPHLYLGPQTGGETGHWSSLLVRSNQRGELMVRVNFHPTGLDLEELDKVRDDIVRCFCSSEDFSVTSLYLALMRPDGRRETEELLYGSQHIEEEILGRRMLLGPDSFFQGNHAAAELLVGLVKSRIGGGFSQTVTLLDLCCGAGFYSLQVSARCRGCVGVDMTDTRLAAINARENGLSNCSFITGKVGSVMSALATEVRKSSGEVMAVLNPGRAGVEPRVIQELRAIPLLYSLIYVSCEPEDRQVQGNLLDLVREDKAREGMKTKPFSLVEAIPLDMFPHTHHCEHVFVLKRKPLQ